MFGQNTSNTTQHLAADKGPNMQSCSKQADSANDVDDDSNFTIPYGDENYTDKGKRTVKSKIVINSNKKAKLDKPDDEISLPSESDITPMLRIYVTFLLTRYYGHNNQEPYRTK